MKRYNISFFGILIGQILFFYQQDYTVVDIINGPDSGTLTPIFLAFFCAPSIGLLLINMDVFKSQIVEYGQLIISRGSNRNILFQKYCWDLLCRVLVLTLLQFFLYAAMFELSTNDVQVTIIYIVGYLFINFIVVIIQCLLEMHIEAHMAMILMSLYTYISVCFCTILNYENKSLSLLKILLLPGLMYANNNNIKTEPHLFFFAVTIVLILLIVISVKRLNKIDILR